MKFFRLWCLCSKAALAVPLCSELPSVVQQMAAVSVVSSYLFASRDCLLECAAAQGVY